MHLYFFNEKTFSQMSANVGLEVLEIKTTPFEANTHNPLIDSVKIVSQKLIRSIEFCTRKHLGNLEVYCTKAPR